MYSVPFWVAKGCRRSTSLVLTVLPHLCNHISLTDISTRSLEGNEIQPKSGDVFISKPSKVFDVRKHLKLETEKRYLSLPRSCWSKPASLSPLPQKQQHWFAGIRRERLPSLPFPFDRSSWGQIFLCQGLLLFFYQLARSIFVLLDLRGGHDFGAADNVDFSVSGVIWNVKRQDYSNPHCTEIEYSAPCFDTRT